MSTRIFQLLALSIATLPHIAQAAVIPIFGTGLDAGGVVLPNTSLDPHYTLVQYPGQVGSTPASTYVVNGITFGYNVSGTGSKWISWSPNWENATPSGQWTYRTTFDLTGFVPGTASLTGRFLVDDDATLFLNGVNTGVTGADSATFVNFNFTSGFVPGINTLDLRVNNASFVSFNPSALRVEVSGTAAAMPEPTAALLLAAGALALLTRPRPFR